jgi:hypothetical protein
MAIELIKIIPYKDGDTWYMELVYEVRYEDGSIRHRVFPKVLSPFMPTRIDICTGFSIYADSIPKMNLYDDQALIYRGRVTGYTNIEGNNVCVDDVLYVDILKKNPDTREMTLAEIEKELGYPVKIVRGEE